MHRRRCGAMRERREIGGDHPPPRNCKRLPLTHVRGTGRMEGMGGAEGSGRGQCPWPDAVPAPGGSHTDGCARRWAAEDGGEVTSGWRPLSLTLPYHRPSPPSASRPPLLLAGVAPPLIDGVEAPRWRTWCLRWWPPSFSFVVVSRRHIISLPRSGERRPRGRREGGGLATWRLQESPRCGCKGRRPATTTTSPPLPPLRLRPAPLPSSGWRGAKQRGAGGCPHPLPPASISVAAVVVVCASPPVVLLFLPPHGGRENNRMEVGGCPPWIGVCLHTLREAPSGLPAADGRGPSL